MPQLNLEPQCRYWLVQIEYRGRLPENTLVWAPDAETAEALFKAPRGDDTPYYHAIHVIRPLSAAEEAEYEASLASFDDSDLYG